MSKNGKDNNVQHLSFFLRQICIDALDESQKDMRQDIKQIKKPVSNHI